MLGGSCALLPLFQRVCKVLDILPDRTALQEKDKLVAEVMRYVVFKMQQTSVETFEGK